MSSTQSSSSIFLVLLISLVVALCSIALVARAEVEESYSTSPSPSPSISDDLDAEPSISPSPSPSPSPLYSPGISDSIQPHHTSSVHPLASPSVHATHSLVAHSSANPQTSPIISPSISSEQSSYEPSETVSVSSSPEESIIVGSSSPSPSPVPSPSIRVSGIVSHSRRPSPIPSPSPSPSPSLSASHSLQTEPSPSPSISLEDSESPIPSVSHSISFHPSLSVKGSPSHQHSQPSPSVSIHHSPSPVPTPSPSLSEEVASSSPFHQKSPEPSESEEPIHSPSVAIQSSQHVQHSVEPSVSPHRSSSLHISSPHPSHSHGVLASPSISLMPSESSRDGKVSPTASEQMHRSPSVRISEDEPGDSPSPLPSHLVHQSSGSHVLHSPHPSASIVPHPSPSHSFTHHASPMPSEPRHSSSPMPHHSPLPSPSPTPTISCFGISARDGSVCSGHGTCFERDTCNCTTGWAGDDCSDILCNSIRASNPNVCGGFGECAAVTKDGRTAGECQCFDGYVLSPNNAYQCIPVCYGISATTSTVCGGHGICEDKNTCTCTGGYTGDLCTVPPGSEIEPLEPKPEIGNVSTTCYGIDGRNSSVCGGIGVCKTDSTCWCPAGYSGLQCTFAIPTNALKRIEDTQQQLNIINAMPVGETVAIKSGNVTITITKQAVAAFDAQQVFSVPSSSVAVAIKVSFPDSFGSDLKSLSSSLGDVKSVSVAIQNNKNNPFENAATTAASSSTATSTVRGQQFAPGSSVMTIDVYADTTSNGQKQVSINNLKNPILFNIVVLNTSTELENLVKSFGNPACQYWDTTKNAWSSEGVSTISSEQSSGTGNSWLYRLNCSTNHLTSFGSVIPAAGVNWNTMSFVIVIDALGLIAFAIFVTSDIVASCTAKKSKSRMSQYREGSSTTPVVPTFERSERSKASDDQEHKPRSNDKSVLFDATLFSAPVQDALIAHSWLAVVLRFVMFCFFRETGSEAAPSPAACDARLRKYQALATLWTSLILYGVGSLALTTSLRTVYFPLPQNVGVQLIAPYFVPAILCAFALAKPIQIALQWLFARTDAHIRLKPDMCQPNRGRADDSEFYKQPTSSLVSFLHGWCYESRIPSLVNLVLLYVCASVVIAMSFLLIYLGLGFDQQQGAVWVIGALVAIAIDAAIIEPLTICAIRFIMTYKLVQEEKAREAIRREQESRLEEDVKLAKSNSNRVSLAKRRSTRSGNMASISNLLLQQKQQIQELENKLLPREPQPVPSPMPTRQEFQDVDLNNDSRSSVELRPSLPRTQLPGATELANVHKNGQPTRRAPFAFVDEFIDEQLTIENHPLETSALDYSALGDLSQQEQQFYEDVAAVVLDGVEQQLKQESPVTTSLQGSAPLSLHDSHFLDIEMQHQQLEQELQRMQFEQELEDQSAQMDQLAEEQLAQQQLQQQQQQQQQSLYTVLPTPRSTRSSIGGNSAAASYPLRSPRDVYMLRNSSNHSLNLNL